MIEARYRRKDNGIKFTFMPNNEQELQECLSDPLWRICSGALYKIIIKAEDGEDGKVMPFLPNRAQRQLLKRLWHRNVILKARQLGFTTLVCIIWLDTALFEDNTRCGIIAQDREAAEVIFRDKVKFAYENLPEQLKNSMPLARDSASELLFAHNNSSIRVATSMRSGTIHRLHVSEFGKICAKYPDKAVEVITGSIPAVPLNGILIIESTAEGQEGDFYNITQRAKALFDAGTELSMRDYRYHFFAWWDEPKYVMPLGNIKFTDRDKQYFERIEAQIGRSLAIEQRAWYVATRDADFSGSEEKMWQEYPSCIAGDVKIGTVNGIVSIKNAIIDGDVIKNHFYKGVKEVFKIKTRLGYEVRCTDDHPIKISSGEFKKICEGLSVGDSVVIGKPLLSQKIQYVSWNPVPFVSGKIEINEDFAEFLGVFMGDGSFYNGTVSVACDSNDTDTIIAVEKMFDKFLGGSSSRVTGTKKGCIEVRKSNIGFIEPMLALDIIEKREAGGLKRKVHVPSYIFCSPKNVIAAFLRGLFEADGFAARDGVSVKFFSKHKHVVQDVQLLLLALGIESRTSTLIKQAGLYKYSGSELVLRADGVRKFAKEIGFISSRKQNRANLSLNKRKTGSKTSFNWVDEILSIERDGVSDVYDITTSSHEFDAGGIVVHNCAEEAFQKSTEGCYYTEQLTKARKDGRICSLPVVDGVPVNTFWDIGSSDGTAIWFHQRIGQENRFIRFCEAWGEPYSYFVRYMQGLGYVWGKHYLPHDATHKRQQGDSVKSPEDMLYELGLRDIEIVPRVDEIQHGIQATRDIFSQCWFDETHCKEGLAHLQQYRKEWNDRQGCWKDKPRHDIHSEAADAFRQFAQGYKFRQQIKQNQSRPLSWKVV